MASPSGAGSSFAGVDRVLGSYWGVLPVEFAADRRIVGGVTDGWIVRFPERQRTVQSSPPETVAFVFRIEDDNPNALWLPFEEYRRDVVAGVMAVLVVPELEVPIDAQPVHLAAAADLVLADDRNVVLGLTRRDARPATDA